MDDMIADAVAYLEGFDIQPTVRQVSRLFGLSDGVTKPILRAAVERGALNADDEWIEQARGRFRVYRRTHPAVRVA